MRASMTIAGIAFGICALAAIAYFVGWIPSTRAPVAAAPASASKPPQAVTTQSGIVLLPGETLVAPPDPVAAPATPPAAVAPPAPAARAPSPPKYAKPAPPKYAREERRPSAYERSTRSVCLNCGVITGITRNDYDWEVRVRFDDGSREIHRFYDRPRFQPGDAVRLEDGRLLPD